MLPEILGANSFFSLTFQAQKPGLDSYISSYVLT